MSADDKAEEYKGRAKEALGSLTDDQDLKSEGKTDQASSSVKQGIEHAADKAKDAAEAAKNKLTGE